MARPPSDRPTAAETEILEVLWARGRQTIQQVHEECHKRRPTAISTIATFVRLMVNKGYVRKHDEDPRRHEFEAIITKEEACRRAATDLRDRIFGGSLRALVSHAYRGTKPSAAELGDLRKLLDDAKKLRTE